MERDGHATGSLEAVGDPDVNVGSHCVAEARRSEV